MIVNYEELENEGSEMRVELFRSRRPEIKYVNKGEENMEKKINFKEARITIAKALLAELDEPVTKLLSEISDNEEYSLADRLEMIEAVPFVAGEIVDKLYSTIEYYEEQIENEKNKEE